MKIELFYFKGCPTYIKTSENLGEVLSELRIQTKIEMIEVLDPNDAVMKKFLGSPTIKINDVDLEHKDGNYMFGCRVYSIDGKMQGTPSIIFIRKHLNSFISA